MNRLVWAFGWAGVVVWSLICAATYGIFDLVGRFFMRNADAFAADPDVVVGVWNVFSFLHSLSTGAVVVAWAVVSLLILAVPWAIDRMVGPRPVGPVGPVARSTSGPLRYGPGEAGVIDLGPDQYSVRTGRPGPDPRIPRGR